MDTNLNSTNINSCEELYLIEKAIEVVVRIADESETVRIEALKSLQHDGSYSTRAYIKEHGTIQPTYSKTVSEEKKMCVFGLITAYRGQIVQVLMEH